MFEPTAGRTFGSNRRQMAAWIIPPAGHGNVRIVQVGSGSSLTRPITEWHKALQETAASIAQDGEKSATDRLRKATGPLSKRLGKSKSPDPFDLFGAAHMPDFETRLLKEYGLKRKSTEWVRAWKLK
jgi:hypothetical protein